MNLSLFGELKDVEVLRPGTFTASDGSKVTFTEDDLKVIANNFNVEEHEPPLTLDHNDSGPAYGWLHTLKYDDMAKRLLCNIKDVPQNLMELVKNRQYKKVSAEVYKNLDAKGSALRAVTLLGARPPAVKGLRSVALADGKEFVSIDVLGEEEPEDVDFKEFKEFIDNKLSAFSSKAESTDVVKLKESLDEATKQLNTANAAIASLQESKKSLEEATRKLAMSDREREIDSTLVALQEEGVITPAQVKGGLRDVLLALETSGSKVKLGEKEVTLKDAIVTLLMNGQKGSVLDDIDYDKDFDPSIAREYPIVDSSNRRILNRDIAIQLSEKTAKGEVKTYNQKRELAIRLAGGGVD